MRSVRLRAENFKRNVTDNYYTESMIQLFQLNPQKTVPFLVDDDLKLSERSVRALQQRVAYGVSRDIRYSLKKIIFQSSHHGLFS